MKKSINKGNKYSLGTVTCFYISKRIWFQRDRKKHKIRVCQCVYVYGKVIFSVMDNMQAWE